MVIEGRTWLELITPRECWTLLATAEVGRVAVLVDGRPEIYPVNFAVDGESIVFRTDRGSKLLGLQRTPDTSFEVDGTGMQPWSVLVKGRATEITRGPDAAHVATLPLDLWAYGEKSRWIRITPEEITGRRLYRPHHGRGRAS